MNKDFNKNYLHPADLQILPIERAETIPSHWYTKPDFHPFDLNNVISPGWQCVGHISRLKERGYTIPLTICGNPVFLLRDDNDVVKAFFNVCMHRGGPLIDKEESIKFIKCLYHGWTYRLDGSLRGVPHFKHAELFDKSDFGLKEIEVEILDGLIWLRLQKSSNAPEFEFLTEGISEKIKNLKLESFSFGGIHEYDVACNWKVYVDNYLEGYHIPHVHPELCDLLSFKDYKTVCKEWYSLQYSPFKEKESLYSSEGGEALYYFVYPNSMLNILPGRLQINRVEPVNHRSCKVIFEYYYKDVSDAVSTGKMKDDMEFSNSVQQEDMDICEKVQRGLESKVYHKGRYSPEMETSVHHFHNCIRTDYRKAGTKK